MIFVSIYTIIYFTHVLIGSLLMVACLQIHTSVLQVQRIHADSDRDVVCYCWPTDHE